MSKVVGSLVATTALGAGMLYSVDPLTCLTRAGFAFILGWAGCTIWHVVFNNSGGGNPEWLLTNSDDANSDMELTTKAA